MKRINIKDILARALHARALHATPLRITILLFFLQPATAQRLVTPFSEKLPSETCLASLSPENSPSDITASERELLFLGPPGGDTGGKDAVGEASVKECLWVLVICCLVYGIIMRYTLSRKLKHTVNQVPPLRGWASLRYAVRKLKHPVNKVTPLRGFADAVSRHDGRDKMNPSLGVASTLRRAKSKAPALQESGTDSILVARRFNVGELSATIPQAAKPRHLLYEKNISGLRRSDEDGFMTYPALKRRATNMASVPDALSLRDSGRPPRAAPAVLSRQGQHFINRMLQLPDMMQTIQPQSRRDGTLLSEP
jgi:hypothetical protein